MSIEREGGSRRIRRGEDLREYDRYWRRALSVRNIYRSSVEADLLLARCIRMTVRLHREGGGLGEDEIVVDLSFKRRARCSGSISERRRLNVVFVRERRFIEKRFSSFVKEVFKSGDILGGAVRNSK